MCVWWLGRQRGSSEWGGSVLFLFVKAKREGYFCFCFSVPSRNPKMK